MRQIDKIINTNERIIWEGTPNVKVRRFANIILFGFLFLGLLFSSLSITSESKNYIDWFLTFFTGFIILCILYWLSSMYDKNILYVITDKRVIIQSGLIGLDYTTVDFDKIQSMSVNVGVVDKLLKENTGSINIYSGTLVSGKHGVYSVPHSLNIIDDPYTVFEKLKKVSHDIKSDIEYPNDLRPKSNPGYNTEYKG